MKPCTILLALGAIAFLGCSSSDTQSSTAPGGGSDGDAQTPATGAANVEAWLERREFDKWACEPAVHEARSPSPHGFNRICSNDVLSANATKTTDWPAGAAAVKELFSDAAGKQPAGHAVYLKTGGDSAAGAGWYWYEEKDGTLVADGLGDGGVPQSLCVGCHAGAGMDAQHTPSQGSRDFVYTPVH